MSTSLIKFLGLYIVALSLLSVPSQGATLSCPRDAKGAADIIYIPDEAVTKYKLDTVKDQQTEDKEVDKHKPIKFKKNIFGGSRPFNDSMNVEKETGCHFTAEVVTGQSADCTGNYACGFNAGLGVSGPKGTNGDYHSVTSLDMSDLESKGFKGAIKSTLESVRNDSGSYLDDARCRGLQQSSCFNVGLDAGLHQRELNSQAPAPIVAAAPPTQAPPVAAAPAPTEEFNPPAIDESCKRFNDKGPAGGAKTELCPLADQCIATKTFAQTCSCDTAKACLGSYTAFCEQAKNVGNAVCNVGTSFAASSAPSTRSNIAMTPALSSAIADTRQKLADFKKTAGSNSYVMNCGLRLFINKDAKPPVTCDPNAPYQVSLRKLEKWLDNPQEAQFSGKVAFYNSLYNTLSNKENAEEFLRVNNLNSSAEAAFNAFVASTKTLVTDGFFSFIAQPKGQTRVATSMPSNSGFIDPMDIITRLNNGDKSTLACLIQPDSKLSPANSKVYLDAIIADSKRVKNLNDWIQFRCKGVRPPDAKGPWIPNKSTN